VAVGEANEVEARGQTVRDGQADGQRLLAIECTGNGEESHRLRAGDAAASNVDSAGGARASEVVAEAPEQRSIGAVAASDAFFPFADGLQVLIDAGVKAVVQPGGSVRDQESIDAANAAGITMYLTGTRHFAH